MVGNEVKRANDDDHGEFEGTTDCGAGREKVEKKRERERWTFDATVKVKTEANSGQQFNTIRENVSFDVLRPNVVSQAVSIHHVTSFIFPAQKLYPRARKS